MTDSTPTAQPTNISRTWQARCAGSYGDGAPVSLGSYVITLTADCQGRLSALIDGVARPVTDATCLLRNARDEGTLTLLREERPFAGKREARKTHIVLGSLGYGRHYELASEALCRQVTSLANLTLDDLSRVRSYAYGQLGKVG